MENRTVGFLSLFALVVAIFTSVSLGLTSWRIDQDINGWKDRAQVSSEPNDMLAYMTKVKEGMERWGMTSGNAALFFPTPSTEMDLIYRTVDQHVVQAQVLTTMDRTTPEYQTGLDNLRGSIRELDVHAFQYYANHQGLATNFLCWLTWIAFLVFGIWWMVTV